MKRITYTMELLSSLIISPRSGQAFYNGIDEFCLSPCTEVSDIVATEKNEVKVVYPFYQYGEYAKYDPKHANYYVPGSSIKGALQSKGSAMNHFMADDVMVPNGGVVLRNLWKAQYLENEEAAEFGVFFSNVGIEMIKDEIKLQGELYLEENIDFTMILEAANKDTISKVTQMCTYLRTLLKKKYNSNLKNNLHLIERNLSSLLNENDVILLGGYKGLLHSILLDNHKKELSGGLFIDYMTMFPHGIVKIKPVVNL